MKMKFFVVGLLCLYFSANAQSDNLLKPLGLGDPMPDLEFSNVLNYNGKALKTSDFKEKLLILDFWNTWCSSCLAAIPRIEELAHRYRSQISLIGVNDGKKDSFDKVRKFVEVRQKAFDFKTIYGDKRLNMLFPHQTVPHCVWIFKNKIIAITQIDEISAVNIEQVLITSTLNTAIKNDFQINKQRPIFLSGNGGDAPSYITRVIITPYKDNLVYNNTLTAENGNIYGETVAGATKFVLYTSAYPEFGNYQNNRIIYRVQHPEDYSPDSTSVAWSRRNRFIYEACFPPRSRDSVLLLMRSHLEEAFKMSLDSELLEKPCLVISKIDKKYKSITSKSTTLKTNWWQYDGLPITVTGMPFASVVEQIDHVSKTPVVDETGITGYVDLTLPRDLTDIDQLNSYLNKVGLSISLQTRKLYYAVFSEAEFSKTSKVAHQ